MAEMMVPGYKKRGSEFFHVNATTRIYGACGIRGLGSAACPYFNADYDVVNLYWLMFNAGLCDSEGITTIASIGAAANKIGLPIVANHSYDGGWGGGNWRAFFEQYAGVQPFVAQVGHGQSLVDFISGLGENANNLLSHFITVYGRNTGGWSPLANRNLPPGYWCADGDNYAGGNNRTTGFAAANVLQYYPDDVMQAAWPTAALVVAGQKVATHMAWVKQADGSGKDDKGNVCGSGTLDAVLAANMGQYDGRMSETHYSASGVADVAFLPLVNGAVFHAVQQVAGGAWAQDQNAAQVAIDLYEAWHAADTMFTTAKGELATADASLASANAALQTANAKIAALEQQLQQQPPASDPTAVALVAAIKAALAA
jgi:hypothetical protein